MDIQEILHIKSLLIKKLQRKLTKQETLILQRWLEASPQNREMYNRISGKEFMNDVIHDDSALLQQQWKKLNQRTIQQKHRHFSAFLKYAAAVLLPAILITGIFLSKQEKDIVILAETDLSSAYIQLMDGSTIPIRKDTTTITENDEVRLIHNRDFIVLTSKVSATEAIHWNKIVIPKGMDYIIRLEDGTFVHLNAESTLEIPSRFGTQERSVRLSGGAFFNVVPDKKRPFTVKIEETNIKVLGTQFDVRAYADQSEILATLIHGSVEVNNKNNQVILEPGMQATICNDGQIAIKQVNTSRYTAWRNGRLVFDNEYITDVIQELSHWYDYDFLIIDPSIRELRFTMNIERFHDFVDFKQAVEKIEKIKFSIEGKVVKITKQ